jgi:hypothetical protein
LSSKPVNSGRHSITRQNLNISGDARNTQKGVSNFFFHPSTTPQNQNFAANTY